MANIAIFCKTKHCKHTQTLLCILKHAVGKCRQTELRLWLSLEHQGWCNTKSEDTKTDISDIGEQICKHCVSVCCTTSDLFKCTVSKSGTHKHIDRYPRYEEGGCKIEATQNHITLSLPVRQKVMFHFLFTKRKPMILAATLISECLLRA